MQNRSDEFGGLMWSAEQLQSALESDPNLITEQDENGLTILHHEAQIGQIMGSTNASYVLSVLFNAPGLDFTIKDHKGNTPLHVAAVCCTDRVTCQYVFPALVKEAAACQFDFTTLGEHGQSVLHIATRTSYTDPRGFFPRINNVRNVLDNAPNPGIDTLSTSVSTAFFYAVNHGHFAEAHALLEKGANPMLFGAKDRDPFIMLDQYIKKLTEDLSNNENTEKHEKIKAAIKQFHQLKQKMLENPIVKSYGELRKSSRILAQGARTDSLFANLPKEICIKIAGHTKSQDVHVQEKAEEIANKHFNKPSI